MKNTKMNKLGYICSMYSKFLISILYENMKKKIYIYKWLHKTIRNTKSLNLKMIKNRKCNG